MINKRLSILLGYFCVCASALAQTSKIDSSEMVTLRIDPNSAKGASVSQIFEEVKFIPLETNKESVFGKISQLEIVKNRFIIFDYDTKSILIFNKEGKFLTKINTSKITKSVENNEAIHFSRFYIRQDSIIEIQTTKYFVYFNLDGTFIKKATFKEYEFIPEQFFFADSSFVLRPDYLVKKGRDSIYYEFAILKNKKDIKRYFPFDYYRQYNDELLSGDGKSRINYETPNELLLVRYYDYNIYKATPKGIGVAYRFIFPANNSLPSDFLLNPVYKNKRMEYFQKNMDEIYGISGTYKIGNNLYFKANILGFDKTKKEDLIYNLKSGELISIGDLEPDSLSSFLPITDSGFHFDFSNSGFLDYKDNYLYTSYSSLAMFTFRDQSAGKNPKYNEVLSNYFKTQDKKSNPVIIQLKPKKD